MGLVTTVVKEAEKLLNCPNSVERMPSMNPTDPTTKYLVAAKDAKTGMHECLVHHDHVTCKCPCNKYNGLCKHSLCVAERANLLKEHVDFLLKSSCRNKPSKSNLVEPQKIPRERKAVATETLGDLAGRKAVTARTANMAHPPTVLAVQSITTTSPSSYVSYQIRPKRQSVGSAV